jgi:hypothetical protein
VGPSLHFILPILMVLLGFLGMGRSISPRTKVRAWAFFQMGWLIAFFEMEPHGGAVTIVGLFAAVSLGILLVLWALARQAPSPEPSQVTNRKGSK